MKLPLKLESLDRGSTTARWRDSEPFVMNARGILIHRPRTVTVHKIPGGRWPAHLAIHFYCGMGAAGKSNFTFLAEPPKDRFVCAPCEARAVMMGLPSASELCGRHVCVGRMKAVLACDHPEIG